MFFLFGYLPVDQFLKIGGKGCCEIGEASNSKRSLFLHKETIYYTMDKKHKSTPQNTDFSDIQLIPQ
uniref:Uncharacterized protein n=1 Tax=Megaselia scalaris TaxID=36166 RepID=T1GF12_MEGSC